MKCTFCSEEIPYPSAYFIGHWRPSFSSEKDTGGGLIYCRECIKTKMEREELNSSSKNQLFRFVNKIEELTELFKAGILRGSLVDPVQKLEVDMETLKKIQDNQARLLRLIASLLSKDEN